MEDLSKYPRPITEIFKTPKTKAEWEPYKLSDDQVRFFHEQGYLSGIKLLDEEQVTLLREELTLLMDSEHPRHELFHEFHSNESADPNAVLFHSLGHWRIEKGFH